MKKLITLVFIVVVSLLSLSFNAYAVGIPVEAMNITKANIKIDGSMSDWKNVKTAYYLDYSVNGRKNNFVHTVKLAWDGSNKLYVTATIKQPKGLIKNKRPKNAPDWWNDDAFQIGIQPAAPKNEISNKATALHYAVGEKYTFTSKASFGAAALKTDATVKIIHLKNNIWSVEMSIPLKGTALTRIRSGKEIYINLGVEGNSAGEFSCLGGKTGNFWTPANWIKTYFKK